MLSLPLIPPRPDATLWPAHRISNPTLDNSTADSHNPASNHRHRRPGSRHGHDGRHDHHSAPRSLLATLASDENLIFQRKQNVRRFGAGWIRPPGVGKTYQTLMDEEAERQEQAAIDRREQQLLDLAAAETERANREQAAEGQDAEMMDADAERDLDDDVPEAQASQSDISGSEDLSDIEEGDTSALGGQADMTFNEDSFIEGSSVVAGEVEHMLEMEEAEMAGVLQDERDLDDDVPEAGSYEHTDTELDYTSEEADSSHIPAPGTGRGHSGRRSSGRRSSDRRSSGRRSSGRRSSGLPGMGARISHAPRSSMNLDLNNTSFGLDGSSSLLDGSSFLRSSPVAARASLRSRFMGGAQMPRGG